MLLWAFFYRRIAMKMRMILFLTVLFTYDTVYGGWIQFNDGGTHDIDYQINEDVWVDYQAPNMGTTLNLLSGGKIFEHKLKGYQDSRINILGGHMEGVLYSYDDSYVNISGGITNYVSPFGDSRVDISGGLIHYIWAYENSSVDVSNATIRDYLYAEDYTIVNIYSGTIGTDLEIWNNSQVDFFGGTIGYKLRLGDNSLLTIHGSNFTVDGQPFSGEINSILGGGHRSEPQRHLTGVLSSGEIIDNDFYIGNNASINLVPEPGTIVLLVTGLIACGFLLRRK
ncbi:MAG: hypothetical protein A2402_02470 [Candidatus Staskawiczbacteria bacterium RIFOXYC1_FULL_37_43]|nr:MAG: hypothetical protein A2813_02350 [Candidatus Staskawiczbacteria bacterium RIFCSPHIGHO2_01_FULL_37_17]OGZ72483.1 MAG: hypothetical protein A2891_00270 [Candidatus Staskawiczbacteria bacterium RIFCSPLOWO2_01_FULL_37_19]OGZ75664.1 MAG: hypothetical protein A2205_00550 [Candidatus Staskawiczbacteria bacterium RIFOXYA1_FULL_37_15]OGZ79941.1 MAG: hypothetical protein A2353_01790 [Candidatus Staskawiczbacteria bacterium RIFOXYB1_FULL_38_37]OGZ81526.1 MAG: hypothetical protein A2402_02470 [Cand